MHRTPKTSLFSPGLHREYQGTHGRLLLLPQGYLLASGDMGECWRWGSKPGYRTIVYLLPSGVQTVVWSQPFYPFGKRSVVLLWNSEVKPDDSGMQPLFFRLKSNVLTWMIINQQSNKCWLSWFVNSYIVFYLHPANRAFLQVFAAFYTGCIVLTREVHTILVLITANHASVWVGLHAHHCSLYLADVGLIWTDFEHGLVLDFEKLGSLPFHRKSLPSSVCCAHIFNPKLPIENGNCGVNVAQMLIIREVDQVVRFSTDCDFSCFRNFDHDIVGRAFNDVEGKNASN